MFVRIFAILSLFAVLAGAPHAAAAQDTLTVFAAASMKNALDDTNAAFTKATGVKVTASYAASSALAKQIEQGAPADVFVSADLEWMDYVAEHKLIKPDTRVNLLGNRLVLIAPKDSKLDKVDIGQGFDIAKLAGDGRIAVADVKAVPAGLYAKAALEKLGAWKAAEPKLAMAENVRATLAFVARGETPIGIVYETDAKIEPKVKIVGVFPDGLASAGHLSGGGDHGEHECRGHALSGLPAQRRGQGDLREIRLQLSDQAGVVSHMFDLTPEDWIAVQLSLRIALVATVVALPFGIAIAYVLARKDFWGKSLLDARGASAAGAAAGGHRLSAADHVRPQGAGRRLARRSFRHRVLVPLDRRGAGLRRDGVSADGARHPAVDRGDRPAAGRCRLDARRQRLLACSSP